jgi:hypothetical protein
VADCRTTPETVIEFEITLTDRITFDFCVKNLVEPSGD